MNPPKFTCQTTRDSLYASRCMQARTEIFWNHAFDWPTTYHKMRTRTDCRQNRVLDFGEVISLGVDWSGGLSPKNCYGSQSKINGPTVSFPKRSVAVTCRQKRSGQIRRHAR